MMAGGGVTFNGATFSSNRAGRGVTVNNDRRVTYVGPAGTSGNVDANPNPAENVRLFYRWYII